MPQNGGTQEHGLQFQASNMAMSNINMNSFGLGSSQNYVQVQVSQAPTMIHQQNINQVLSISSPSSTALHGSQVSSAWTNCTMTPQHEHHLVNVNLNSGTPGSTARIITTAEPGQHPVISIPDTTQGDISIEGGDILGGQEFDIFKAIEGMTVKVSSGDSTANVQENINNVATSNSAMANGTSAGGTGVVGNNSEGGVEEVGQIIIDNSGNCVCDLRALVTCRNCGSFCHMDCISPSELCMTCLIR